MGRRLVSVLNLRHLLAYCRNVILHAGGSPEHPGLISGGNGVEVCKLMLIWRPIGSGQSLNSETNTTQMEEIERVSYVYQKIENNQNITINK